MERRVIFDQQIEAVQRDLRILLERAGGGAPDQRAQMAQVVEALSASLEEMHAANEELRQQDEALLNARLGVEAERQRYQELFEFAPDGYLVTDANGVISEANHAAAGLLRVSQNHLLGNPLAAFVAREDRSAFYVQLAQLAQAERVVDWELYLKPHRAPSFPASIAVAVACDDHGRAAGLRWQLRDITRRKHGEEALRQAHAELESRVQARTADLAQANEALRAEVAERKAAEQALRVALEKYRVLFESLPLGITVSDHAGQIVETNKEAVRLLGVPRAEHSRRYIDDPQWRLIRPDGSPMPAGEYASVRALQENRLIDNVEMGIDRKSVV